MITSMLVARKLIVVALVAVVGLLVWAVGWSSLFTVAAVDVQAPATVSAAQVRAAVGDLAGVPLARVDLSRVQARVEQIPTVASATVTRSWPRTLQVVVVARVPVVALKSGGSTALVDSSGSIISTVATPPLGLPLLRTGAPAGTVLDVHTPNAMAAISVAALLPVDLRSKVVTVGAVGVEDVRLTLIGGALVRWGGTGEALLKSSVLRALLKHPARVYDVSAPKLPTTRS